MPYSPPLHTRIGRVLVFAAIACLAACGAWAPAPWTHAAFTLECTHATAPCESCHTAGLEAPVATECESCHAADAPPDHAPDRTACAECHEDCDWASTVRYHPEGFDAPEAHGTAANLQDPIVGACTECHGADLSGGDGGAVGCDQCHDDEGHPDWRTDCTFCHGGSNGDVLGLPPEDLDGETDEDRISFKAHPEHARVDGHPAYACATCHEMPTDVLSPGHAFDATAAESEVDFSGIAVGGTYASSSATCGLYCHGNGRAPGTVVDGTAPLDCDACHQTTTNLGALSGMHAVHVGEDGITCADCHTDVDAGNVVTTPTAHVDGLVTLDALGIGWDPSAGTCTVTCHGEDHDGDSWTGGGHHPAGYEEGDQHGPDSLLTFVEGDCRDCHGADLAGGTAGVACQDCHDAGWTRDCTYCHGGTLDASGAPPEDLDGTTVEAMLTFQSHHAHMDTANHATYGCDECHGAASLSYIDALSDPLHWFDATPGASEVDFSDGLSPSGSWTGTKCNNVYCHGTGESGSTGDVSDGTAALACDDCHPSATSSSSAIDDMSGEHKKHVIEENADCYECHDDVVDSSFALKDETLHVDGSPDVALASSTSMSITAGRCTGTCHGDDENHNDPVNW